MTPVGTDDEPLESIAIYGFDGTTWRPVLVDDDGRVQTVVQGGSS